MENHQDKFINEATDLIQDIEEAMLTLENKPDDNTLLEDIQRGMHTLKGAGSMYGFSNISELTHTLESLFEFIRDKKLEMSEFFLSSAFLAIDHLKKELQSDNKDPVLNKMFADIMEALKQFVPADEELKAPAKVKKSNETQLKKQATYYIRIKPFADVDARGVNLNKIIDKLNESGKAEILMQPLPDDENANGSFFFLMWVIILSTEISQSEIEDICLFIEDEVEIEKISNNKLLDNESFEVKIKEYADTGEPLGLENAKTYATEADTEIEKTVAAKQKNEENSQNVQVVKVASNRLDELMNLLSDLVITKEEMKLIVKKSGYKNLYKTLENVEKLTRSFRENIFDIRLIRIESTVLQFRRLVRDLSVELKKDVEFIAEGLDTKLDKTILDKLKSPLLHILRNSIDHGIEPPDIRKNTGKPLKGKISFKAGYSGNHVEIEVSDDGAGINLEKVRQTAINKGYITKEQKLSEREILDLTFYQGFTTTDKVSAVSGRGVGMDVVKREISNLSGEIEVSTKKGEGTVFLIRIPLSLSIIDTMLVKVANVYFAIPLVYIDNCWRTGTSDIDDSISNKINIKGEITTTINLRKIFRLNTPTPQRQRVVFVETSDSRAGFLVDKIIGEHQAVIKPLGVYFSAHKYLTGVSLLADGSLAMIIDIGKIIYEQLKMQ